MAELDFDNAFPVRLSSGEFDNHPTVVETQRGLLAAVWERAGVMYRSYSLDRGLTWAAPARFMEAEPIFTPRGRYNHEGGFALVWTEPGDDPAQRDIYFEEISEVMGISEHLMGIRVQRALGTMSKGAELTIANPRRLYDPEEVGTKWTGVILPGAKVEISLGYGGENKKRFSGYIDDVESEDQSAMLTISCRGDMKQLLDGHLRSKRRYTDVKRVDNIANLAIEAGMDADKILIEDNTRTFTEDFDRERTFADVITSHVEALAYEITEPDEGGMICRRPIEISSPAWFYEEDLNMYSRTRNWDDDEVFTSVMVYRDPIYEKDGTTLKVAGLEYEVAVDTPFFTPAKKTDFIPVGKKVTLSDAMAIANKRALTHSRYGRELQLVCPLNVGLEVGDVIQVRRASWNQSGLYLVEALDDDCKRNLGQSRELAGTSQGGQYASGQGGGGGFANIVRTRKVSNL